MENIKKKFGFGCMRLPMKDGEVDTVEFSQMVDVFHISYKTASSRVDMLENL